MSISVGKLAISGGQPLRTASVPEWPVSGPEEETQILETLRSREWWYGEKVQEFERRFAAFQDARFGVTCCNGAVALEIALRAAGVGPGDEVIVPAYTFIATAVAVVQLNAIPVFADVEADTANLDLEYAESLVTGRTRAIIVVHFAGLPVDMDRARDFARRHNLALIEDAAHAWGSQWDGKGAGAIGDSGTFSFQYTKNITAAEGGILLTDNEEYARTARSYTHVGRLEGEAWYEHFLLGGNYRITEFQAALLLAQLGRLEEQTIRREENARLLDGLLEAIPGIRVQPRLPKVTRRSYHMYLIRYNAEEFGGLPRGRFIAALEAEGIPASPGYLHPVYGNVCFQDLNRSPRPEHRWLADRCNERNIRYDRLHCPVAEKFTSEEMIWLPHTMLLGTPEEMEQIAEAVAKIRTYQSEAM